MTNFVSNKSNYNIKDNYISSLGNKSFINNVKKENQNNMFFEKEKSEIKTNNHSLKLKHHNNKRKSFNLPNGIILNNIAKKFKHNYNDNEKNYNNNNSKNFGKTCIINNGTKDNLIKDLSQIEKIKMNEHIFNDINSLQLKKRIAQFKKALKNKTLASTGNNNNKNVIILHSTNTNSFDDKKGENDYTTNETYKSNLIKKTKNGKNEINPIDNKYRMINRRCNLFDSLDDEEYLDEEIGYYISPNSFFIKLFDCLMFFSSLIYFIFIPYFLSQNYFILKNNNVFTIILLFIDVLYIIDIIINFFRAYKNFDEKIIKRTRKIISHYLKTLFLLDLIQAFPYFSLLHFLKQKYNFSIVKNFIPNMKVWQEN